LHGQFNQVALSLTTPALAAETPSPSCPAGDDFTLAIHGGAGVILKENMSDKQEARYRKSLGKALKLGGQMLEEGYSALDSVQFVVMALENDPKFNAGKGAVFSAAGINELDASNQMKKKVKANKIKKHSFLDTPETKYGTVGAVAKDGCGNLAAATSTGGLTAKELCW